MANFHELLSSVLSLRPDFNEEVIQIAILRHIEDKVEKVRFTLDIPFFKANYQQAIRFQNEPKKSASQSVLYREKGNQCYTERRYIPALEYFNKSICFAPDCSEELAKAYANRSAVYFSLKMFELSLKNIKMARTAGYPANLVSKLNNREAKCQNELKMMKTKPKNEFHGLKPKLSYPPHEKVPFIANCLDLKVNEKYGRHIVTKVDLEIGDVVAIERPFCVAISGGVQYMFCANCFRENDLDLIPCPNCHSAMFCNPECLAAANEAFHAVECPIIDVLVRSDKINNKAYNTFRLFVLAMKCFKSVEELMEFVQGLEHREQNVFNVNYQGTQNIDLLASTLKLLRYHQGSPVSMKQDKAYFTAFITKIVLNLTDFKESFTSQEKIDFLMRFIFYLYEVVEYNVVSCSTERKAEPEMKEQLKLLDSGSCYGIYPFFNLLNHSCAPNVVLAIHSTENVMVVLKPIKKGEQLFNCYDIHYKSMNRDTRLKSIRDALNITCDCLACIKDYPMLTFYDFLPLHDYDAHSALCDDYKIDAVKSLIPKYCEFLTVNSEKYPFSNTAVAEEMLFAFLKMVYTDVVPLAEKIRLHTTAKTNEE